MKKLFVLGASLALLAGTVASAQAAVSPDQAAKLKSELTPFGAEKAGNSDGSIPAWDGGIAGGANPGSRLADPFKGDKPLFSITAQNMAQYAEQLTEGTQAMLKKYPDSFRVDVYETHRTAAAPQWVYDNTFENATRGALEKGVPQNVYGGIPYAIPQSGEEVMWNHVLRWRGTAFEHHNNWYQFLADGRAVLVTDAVLHEQLPYYYQDSTIEDFYKQGKPFWQVVIRNIGPPLRAGEALLAHEYLDADKLQTWVYLKGQRRVRKLPNGCCDTPTPAAAGVMTFDEMYTWTGRMDRFDWKMLGKKEMYIPYNTNGLTQVPKDEDVLGKGHLNPDHVRWEKHRVWVVEASVRNGQRHQAARSRYYCDEDTWICVLADRWDGNGELWRSMWSMTSVVPELPATVITSFGYYDLLAGTGFVAQLPNTKSLQYDVKDKPDDNQFTPTGLAGRSIR